MCTTFEDMKVFRCFFHLFAGLYMTLCKRPSIANSPYLKVNCVINIQFSRQLFFSLFNAHFLLFEKHKHDLPVHCPDSPPAHYFLVKALSHRCARCCTSSSCFTTSLCLSLSEKISKCVLSSRYHLISILLISLCFY